MIEYGGVVLAFDKNDDIEPGHNDCVISEVKTIWDVLEKEGKANLTAREQKLRHKTVKSAVMTHDPKEKSSVQMIPARQVRLSDLGSNAAEKLEYLTRYIKTDYDMNPDDSREISGQDSVHGAIFSYYD